MASTAPPGTPTLLPYISVEGTHGRSLSLSMPLKSYWEGSNVMLIAGSILSNWVRDDSRQFVRRETVALKSMSIEKLTKLKSDVEAMLAVKVTEQRRALEAELSKLGGYQRGKRSSAGR